MIRRRIQPSIRRQKRTSHFNIADPPLRERYHKYEVTGLALSSVLSAAIRRYSRISARRAGPGAMRR